jgi:hypothetical protein
MTWSQAWRKNEKSENTFQCNAPQFLKAHCSFEYPQAPPLLERAIIDNYEHGAWIARYWQKQTELHEEKLLQVLLCPPQNSHGLTD